MTLPKVPIEEIRRKLAEGRARLDEEQRLKKSNEEGNRPKTERAGTPLLSAVTAAAKVVADGQRTLDRAIAKALAAGEHKTRIARAANLSPQALSNRIRRDRRRNPKDRKYGPPPDQTW